MRLSEFGVLEDKEAAAALTAGAVAGTEDGSAALLVAETGTTVQDWGFTGPSPSWASTRSLGASESAGRDGLADLLCSLAKGWEGCSI